MATKVKTKKRKTSSVKKSTPKVVRYEGRFIGPMAEGTGVRVGADTVRRIFPRDVWLTLSGKDEADALRQMADFQVREV